MDTHNFEKLDVSFSVVDLMDLVLRGLLRNAGLWPHSGRGSHFTRACPSHLSFSTTAYFFILFNNQSFIP